MVSNANSTTVPADSADRAYQRIKSEVHRQLVSVLDLSQVGNWENDRLRTEVREVANRLATDATKRLDRDSRERMVEELMSEAFGLGPLDALMGDPTINDILVNGPDEVYVDRGGRLEATGLRFADDAHVVQIIQRIAGRVGRRVDEMSPLVDARLEDGSRVNAILPPLALDGPTLSIRRFNVQLEAAELLERGTLTAEMLRLLAASVQARVNLMISGGTGAGKTTLLNVLSGFIPAGERLVTIEDAAELQMRQPHVVRLETRIPNLEGVGEVTQRDLLRNSLRMRPDRIIIGEVRGGEAMDMLQAMNTGHEGSMTTIHANETRDSLNRLEMMVSMAGFEVPLPIIRGYVASALNLLVHTARLRGGSRKVTRISDLIRLKGRKYVVKDIFGFRQTGVQDGFAVGEFYCTGHVPSFYSRLEASGIELDADIFRERVLARVTLPLADEVV